MMIFTWGFHRFIGEIFQGAKRGGKFEYIWNPNYGIKCPILMTKQLIFCRRIETKTRSFRRTYFWRIGNQNTLPTFALRNGELGTKTLLPTGKKLISLLTLYFWCPVMSVDPWSVDIPVADLLFIVAQEVRTSARLVVQVVVVQVKMAAGWRRWSQAGYVRTEREKKKMFKRHILV